MGSVLNASKDPILHFIAQPPEVNYLKLTHAVWF